MKNRDQWKPTKFVYENGRLRASRNEEIVNRSSRFVVDIVARHFDTYTKEFARGRLIDMGCGTAPLFHVYEPHVSDVVCVDWSRSLHDTDYLDMECDLNAPLPFEDGEFDTVLLSDVLEHVSRPYQLWGEMGRILRPGGRVILSVPFYYWIHEEPNDFYRYTKYALTRFAKENGFEVRLIKPIGGAPEILVDILAKNLSKLPVLGKPCTVLLQGTAGLLAKMPAFQRVSRTSAKRFPFGYFMVAERVETSGSDGSAG